MRSAAVYRHRACVRACSCVHVCSCGTHKQTGVQTNRSSSTRRVVCVCVCVCVCVFACLCVDDSKPDVLTLLWVGQVWAEVRYDTPPVGTQAESDVCLWLLHRGYSQNQLIRVSSMAKPWSQRLNMIRDALLPVDPSLQAWFQRANWD